MNKEMLQHLRETYPAGTRVEILQMDDMVAPPPGTQGTIIGVDDIGNILTNWDNGSGLNLISGVDSFRIITDRTEGGAAHGK